MTDRYDQVPLKKKFQLGKKNGLLFEVNFFELYFENIYVKYHFRNFKQIELIKNDENCLNNFFPKLKIEGATIISVSHSLAQ